MIRHWRGCRSQETPPSGNEPSNEAANGPLPVLGCPNVQLDSLGHVGHLEVEEGAAAALGEDELFELGAAIRREAHLRDATFGVDREQALTQTRQQQLPLRALAGVEVARNGDGGRQFRLLSGVWSYPAPSSRLEVKGISEETPQLRIGQVAQRARLRKSAIRYYEQIGLLEPAERVSGQRVYAESVLRRLVVIDVSQRAGLSLDEIRELIEAGAAPASDRLQAIAAKKLPDVEALIARAEAMRDWLKTAEGCGCQTIDECALFGDASADSVRLPDVVRSVG